jgi:8-oxo-dGTP pyrophosphatase MutT (NUDIX family)
MWDKMNNEKTPEPLNVKDVCTAYGKTAFYQNFKLPNGNEDCWFLFRSDDKPVIIFPLTEKNEVVTINIFRFGASSYMLEVPGGKIEGNYLDWSKVSEKEIITTAKRELEEETQYTSDTIFRVGQPTWFDPASVRAAFLPVFALNCFKNSNHTLKPDKNEFIREVRLIPLNRWVEMIKNQEICDAKTIAITMMALCHLGYLKA